MKQTMTNSTSAAAAALYHSETTNHDMTIRLNRLSNRCITLEKKHRWSLDLRWLGKWWGRCGFSSHGRPFFQDVRTEYHHGWTSARHIWLGPFMAAWHKHLTWEEKYAWDESQGPADLKADGKPDGQEENTLL